MQYSLKNGPLNWQEFVKEYEPLYFITSYNKLIRNKSSLFVEKEIENILAYGLKPADLPLILAWKIGTIDHKASINKVVYRDNCNATLEFKTQYNIIKAKPMVDYIKKNFSYLKTLAKRNPYELFINLCENKVDYFGTTYIITVLYFLSSGVLPIYDKYAHIALLAIKNNIRINQTVYGYKPIESATDMTSRERAWRTYIDYCKLLLEVVGEEKYKDRSVDRSLWVYGHVFKTAKCAKCLP